MRQAQAIFSHTDTPTMLASAHSLIDRLQDSSEAAQASFGVFVFHRSHFSPRLEIHRLHHRPPPTRLRSTIRFCFFGSRAARQSGVLISPCD